MSITGQLTGLEPGQHSLNIHQFGDLSSGAVSAGDVFNPKKVTPGNDTRYVPVSEWPCQRRAFDLLPRRPIPSLIWLCSRAGDLGHVTAGADGVAQVDISDSVITLAGPESIIGRSAVVSSSCAPR